MDDAQTAPWSFALDLDPADPTKTLTFAPGGGYVDGSAPFNRTGPLSIKASARLVSSWNISLNSAAPPPESPACAKAGDCGAPVEVTVRVGLFDPVFRVLYSVADMFWSAVWCNYSWCRMGTLSCASGSSRSCRGTYPGVAAVDPNVGVYGMPMRKKDFGPPKNTPQRPCVDGLPLSC